MTEETAGGAHPCESPRARVPRRGHLCPPHVTEKAGLLWGSAPAAAEEPTARPVGMRRFACACLFNRRTHRRALHRQALTGLRAVQLPSPGPRADVGVVLQGTGE